MVFIAVLAEIAHGKAVHDPGHALKELLGQLLFILHLLPRLPLSVQPGSHADDEDRDRCHQQHGKEDHQDRIVTRFTFSMPESTTALLTAPTIDQSLIPTGSYTK